MNKMVIAIFLVVLCMGCKSNTVPKDVLQPKEMKELMWDLLVYGQVTSIDTNANVRLHIKDSMTAQMQTVLNWHHVTQKEFMYSLHFYELHPKVQAELYDSLNAYAIKKQAAWTKKHTPKKIPSAKPDTVKAITKLDSSAKKAILPPPGAVIKGAQQPVRAVLPDSLRRIHQEMQERMKKRRLPSAPPKGYSALQPD